MPVFQLLLVNQGLNHEKTLWNQFLLAGADKTSSMIHPWSQKTHGLLGAVFQVVSLPVNTEDRLTLFPVDRQRHYFGVRVMEVSQHLPRQTRLCFGASFGCYCSPLRAVCHCRKLQQDVFPKVESMLDIWRHQPNPKWATQKLGLGTHGALHLYISLALQFGTRQASMGTLATPEPKRGMRPKTSRQCGNSHGRIWGTKEWNLKSGKQNWASTQGLLGFVSHSWHFVAPWLVFYIAIVPCIIMYHQYSKRFTHQTIQNLTMHVKARIPTTLPGRTITTLNSWVPWTTGRMQRTRANKIWLQETQLSV